MKERIISRRRFFEASAAGLGFLAGAAAAARQEAVAGSTQNPFAYDLDRLGKTDPKLLKFEEVRRFPCGILEPRRIAVGPGGRVYVAGRAGIRVLGGEGAAVDTLSLDGPARCVALAQDGTIYAALRDRIEVMDPAGKRLGTWPGLGKKSWFSGLAAGENDLFAADSGNRVVLRYDRSGKLAGRIGEKNKENHVPGLVVPSPYLDVDLAPDGLLRVNNPGRHCVEAYTLDGDLELSWGKPSAAIEGFCGCCNPVAVAMFADGRCVTSEKGLPRVKVYSAEGALDCVVAGTESFPANAKAGSGRSASDGTLGGLDAAVDPQGSIYVLDLVSGEVTVMKAKAPDTGR